MVELDGEGLEAAGVSGLTGPAVGGSSSPPSRQALGSAKTAEHPEHWYRPDATMRPSASREMTRR